MLRLWDMRVMKNYSTGVLVFASMNIWTNHDFVGVYLDLNFRRGGDLAHGRGWEDFRGGCGKRIHPTKEDPPWFHHSH